MTTLTDEQMELAARELVSGWYCEPTKENIGFANRVIKAYPDAPEAQQAIAIATKDTPPLLE